MEVVSCRGGEAVRYPNVIGAVMERDSRTLSSMAHFLTHPSSFILHPLSFILHPSSFIPWLLGILLAAAGVASAQDGGPLAVPVDGEPFGARLVSIDDQWLLAFQTDSTRRTLPAASLVRWGTCVDAVGGPTVVLADGGLVAAEVTAADREFVSADSALFGSLKLPRPIVAGVLFHPPSDRSRRDLLVDRVLSKDGKHREPPSQNTATDGQAANANKGPGTSVADADLALLVNGDELAGTIERIAGGKIRLQSAVGAVELETRGVGAIRFRESGRSQEPSSQDAKGTREGSGAKRVPDTLRPKGLSACAGFSDGTRIHAAALAVAENSLAVTLQGGITWNTAPKELVFLQPRGGQAVYLSDLAPEGYRHVPFLSLAWPFRADRSVCGAMLRAGAKRYLKGLGMHSASRLAYALVEPYRRFQAELAIDDETEGGGSVRFRVFVDGQVRYASPVVRGGQSPVPISVDVAGAKRLDLVVDFADRADELDHADWLDARLVR